MYFSQLNAYYHCISKYSMKLCGFAEKLKCIIYGINVYSDRPCGANRKSGICRGMQGIEQHCHSEPVRTTFVGISIEFQTIYRHTDCFILPFPGVHPQETVLLSRRLPHQSEDWFAMTGNSPNSNLSVCLRKPITLIRICWAGGAVAFYTTENSRGG